MRNAGVAFVLAAVVWGCGSASSPAVDTTDPGNGEPDSDVAVVDSSSEAPANPDGMNAETTDALLDADVPVDSILEVTIEGVEVVLPADSFPEDTVTPEVETTDLDKGDAVDPGADAVDTDAIYVDAPCVPQCSGKTSGDDGCGGCCGGCCPNGTCEPEKGEMHMTCPSDCEAGCVCGDGLCIGNCGETLETCSVDCHVCGNGACESGEGFQTCPADCCGTCGDGKCAHYVVSGVTYCTEDETNCPDDCHPAACGNGTCEPGESVWQCPADCLHGACGNHVCEPTDGGPQGCPEDCAATCGNCVCEGTESSATCPVDCGYCGDGVCSPCPLQAENQQTCPKDCSDVPVPGECVALDWVAIPGGTFQMGADDMSTTTQPVHPVTVPDYQMARTEVTACQYAACVAAGACLVPAGGQFSDNFPVVFVTWNQSKAFCTWSGGRLCSEAEWEYAARGGNAGNLYPWGNDQPTCELAMSMECPFPIVTAACSTPAGNNAWGICDLAANVEEWVEDDWHDSYTGAPTDGSPWMDSPRGSFRLGRGGTFSDITCSLRGSSRYVTRGVPSAYYAYSGARCCKSP